MTQTQRETLSEMQEAILAENAHEEALAVLACKLLEAHALKPTETFFAEALIREATGETKESRILHMAEAYGLLCNQGWMIEEPSPHAFIPLGGGSDMPVPGYRLTEQAARPLEG